MLHVDAEQRHIHPERRQNLNLATIFKFYKIYIHLSLFYVYRLNILTVKWLMFITNVNEQLKKNNKCLLYNVAVQLSETISLR